MFENMGNTEIWRPVKGFEEKYEVSNTEKYRNIKRSVLIKGRINRWGYRMVGLGKHRGERGFHILVAQAFPEICGEWFEGCHVHHKNFNKLDNRPENLVVLSGTEHTKLHYLYQPDSFKKPSEKRSKSISKALTGRRADYKHIPIVQLTKNGEVVKEWECITDVEKELGYRAGNICWCCKGKLKTAYGFLWRYAVNT